MDYNHLKPAYLLRKQNFRSILGNGFSARSYADALASLHILGPLDDFRRDALFPRQVNPLR